MNILNEEVKRQKELMGLLTEEVSIELTDVDLKNTSLAFVAILITGNIK